MLGSNEKHDFISKDDDFKTFYMIGIPMKSESFASSDVRSRLKMVNHKWDEYTPKNIVYLKFKLLAKNVISALDAKDSAIKKDRDAYDIAMIKEQKQKRIIHMQEAEKILNTPQCKKTKSFIDYCNNKLNICIYSEAINYEKKISARSGTSSSKIRGYTKLLMFSEDKLEESKQAHSQIDGGRPALEDCEVNPGTGSSQCSISGKTKALMSNLLKSNCSEDVSFE
jgi:hypothetical protein